MSRELVTTENSFPLLRVYLYALVVFTLLRLGFLAYHAALFQESSASELATAFGAGLIVDSCIAATTLFLIRLFTLLLQPIGRDFAYFIHRAAIYFCFGIYFFVNLVDIVHFEIYDSRLNILLIENLSQMGPILRTVVHDPALYVVLAIWAFFMILFARMIGRKRAQARGRRTPLRPIAAHAISLVTLAALSFLWLDEPFWRISALSTDNQALNQLSLNGVYTLTKAVELKRRLEREAGGADYGFVSNEQAVESTRTLLLARDEQYVSELYPLARRITNPRGLSIEKPNIVIILMESFTAGNIGALGAGDQGCSPAFDRLAEQGIIFTQFYGQETRAHHGLVSTVGSFPSLLGTFLTRRRGTESFYTLATILKRHGYTTSFIYGFDQGFDHMGFFLKQGGFERIIDQEDFPSAAFRGRWGVSDDDLFDKTLSVFAQSDPEVPLLSVVLTSSNHAPYDIPPAFAQAHPEYAGNKAKLAFAYSDYALGQFMEKARRESFFDKTIFAILADHGEMRDGDDRLLKRFHIPCLIYAPRLIAEPRRVNTIGSQVDIATTLMHLIGYPEPFHFAGRDLLGIPPDDGYAVMRSNFTVLYRYRNAVLVRDIRDTVSALYAVDDHSRLVSDSALADQDLKRPLNQRLENYLQTMHYLFSNGKHRCVTSRGR
ncbi:MAG: LTA synthase family protein [Candidatus Zixiibacteriota bacterium]